MKPLCIDLFCGLGGWTDGFLAEGYRVIGFDIEHHVYGEDRYPGQLVIQDVLTIHGSQFRNAAVIVASPPCQEFSYMAMPWTRAKAIASALRGQGEFPAGYKGSRTIAELRALFDACFRIQREASAAAGRHIPLMVENVRGAQTWVGNSPWRYGSYHLWGDVPALMPAPVKATKHGGDCFNDPAWPGKQGGVKTNEHINQRDGHGHTRHLTNPAEHDGGVKQPGLAGTRKNGKGARWFQDGAASHGSRSPARKAVSARIAKIPFALARHIAHTYRPANENV